MTFYISANIFILSLIIIDVKLSEEFSWIFYVKMFSEYFCIMFACCIVLRTLKPSSFLTFCMWTIFFLLSEVCRIFIPQSVKLHSVMCLWMYFHSLYLSALVPFKYLFDFFSLIHFLYFLWFSKPKYKACFECWLGE